MNNSSTNNWMLVVLALAVLGVGGFFLVRSQEADTDMMAAEETMMEKGAEAQDSMQADSVTMDPETEASKTDKEMMAEESMMAQSDSYIEYSPDAFAAAAGKKRVLFFYASWCPTCRPVDAEILAMEETIPEDVVIFRVDYDTEEELKEKYGVTYQHTFVVVDTEGEAVTKWNGGDLEMILEKVQ